jgi:hypothetical protein
MAGWLRTAVCATALCCALGQAAAEDRLLEGELVRVDLDKRVIILRPAANPAREVKIDLDAATTITAYGRALAAEELETAQRIAVTCDGTVSPSCRARRVRAGPARHAAGPAGPS